MISLTSSDVTPNVWRTNFQCMVLVSDILIINEVNISVGFLPLSENHMLNELAIEKLDYFFSTVLDNSIVLLKDENFKKTSEMFSNNILLSPDNPGDQCLGALLFCKACAIVNGDILIDYITISSNLGRNIEFTITMDSLEIPEFLPPKEEWWDNKEIKEDPWWLRHDTSSYDKELEESLIYKGKSTWEEIFKEEILQSEKFNKDPKKNKFKIIEGGKDAT